MADTSARRQGPDLVASVPVHALAPVRRFVLRGGAEALAAAASSMGLSDPASGRAATGADWALLWLGPDERLLLAAEETDQQLFVRVGDALRGRPHSLVEVSHRQIGLQLSGPHAATILSAGCPLDLDASAFPVGMCTRTVLAKAEIVLWRIADGILHIEVARSFAHYVSSVLAEAAREHQDVA